MLSGTNPNRHGIVNNNWFEGGTMVYCAGTTSGRSLVPPPVPDPTAAKDAKARPKEVGTPERLQAQTVADVLREAHATAKVFGLSLKDRSAILPTGKHPTGAYWFEGGRFVTSDYYTDHVHPWVETINRTTELDKRIGADAWFGKDWAHAYPGLDYFHWLDPVVKALEKDKFDERVKQGKESGEWDPTQPFRHPNTGGKAKPGKEYYDQLATSPAGNDLLLQLTRSCVATEKLGKNAAPDLLVVSFSSNDLIGHAYGPDSPEVLDVTLRSDALMAELLNLLDTQVGHGEYLLAVTADHGVCPTVEVSKALKVPEAERVRLRKLQEAVEDHLTARFAGTGVAKEAKKPRWVEAFAEPNTSPFPWMYLNHKLAAQYGKTPEEVARAAAEFLSAQSGVARAYTRADLSAPIPETAVLEKQIWRSYYPERSGDVYVLLKPYCLPSLTDKLNVREGGTTHGTPYNYDTHVPLLVYGPGIPGGVRREPVTPQATAAIFTKYLGLPRLPNKAEYPVPRSLEGN
jgi:predicted AlkP superfamily pyrophosphatase or phosphodiesterase